MADPYRAYGSSSHDRAVPQGHHPGYIPPEESYYAQKMAALRGVSTIPRVDAPLQSRAYGLDGPAGVSRTALGGLVPLPAGSIPRGASPLEDPVLVRGGSSLGKSASIPDVERPISLPIVDRPSEDESNILFVDGLPTDCTRREVAHLFRPFVGFKDLRLVHKEPRRSGDKAYVLCFVEFSDAKCAFTAMKALQEYRFDERKPDAPVLKIRFARFPFRPPPAHDDGKRLSAR
ncbi:RNA-binding protein 2 isoform X1 [Lolium perenne]|uniref:RNA-binding protein 2 isoform X1 n=1 Tax=Lolium perenne TaxID=4522 RepID=UPI0021F5F013|nr:nuclear speckle RNA-binding protein A-like isoform X1 [Lolium perenne]